MGGRDIPASGFALYFDRLMDLVKEGTLAEMPTRRVLIKAGSGKGALKEAFKLADSLHEDGFVAEVFLGGPEPADLRWLVEVGTETPVFTVTDRTSRKKSEAGIANEVIKLIEA